MADITLVKISALPAAEQIGAEDLLPVVQEGATKAVAYGVIKGDIAEELAPDATLSETGKAADAKAVGDALALKADKTTVTTEVNRIDAALNTKVNNTTYTAEVERIDGAIATKADAAETTAALATKANANDVTAALALKADKNDLDEVTDAVYTKSYNLVNCNSASFWSPVAGKDVSISTPSADMVRVTSNVSQQYAAARSGFIDVSNVSVLYAKIGSYSGTGNARCRIYGVSEGELVNPVTVNRTGVTYDVSAYNQICVELAATTGTASDGYIDYYELLVAASAEPLPYVPYYQDNVQAAAETATTAENKADNAQATADDNTELLQHLVVRSRNLFNIDDLSVWKPTDARKPVTVTSETAGTITVTAEAATTYSGAYYIMEVRNVDSLYIHYEYDGGTGQRYARLFNSDGESIGTVIATINNAGSVFDVSDNDYVAIAFYAIFNSSGYSAGAYCTYSEIMVCASTEPVAYEPYKIYEPIGTEALSLVNSLSKDIKPLNADAIATFVNANFRSVRAEAPSGSPSVLALLHFSDLHADTDNLRRIVEFKTAFSDYINDAICTGDMVRSKYFASAMNFWKGVNGASAIMMCIGNHDVWREDATEFVPGSYITQQAAYDEYIAPYAAAWGVTYTQGHTYYYKDYTAQKIRLIVLDMMLVDTERAAQLTWLTSTLTSAKTAGYSVVIAQHFAPRPNANFECNFTALDRDPSTTEGWSPDAAYMDAVEDFINGGGDFICWLGGHTHCDYVCYNPNYIKQLFVTITCALCDDTYSDQARVNNTKSQDAFNIIAFDTYSKLIKILRIGANTDSYYRPRNTLTINYATRNIVASN